MGIDIHCFVEYDDSDDGPAFGDPDAIRPFNEGELFWWRHPPLFAAMGFVHPQQDRATDDRATCRYPVRGLPEHLGSAVINRFFYIVDDLAYRSDYHPSLGSVGSEQARKWLDSGQSFHGPPMTIARKAGTQHLERVSNPTWMMPSWLSTAEFLEAVEHAGLAIESLNVEVRATIQTMQFLESEFGPKHARLVFWFDS